MKHLKILSPVSSFSELKILCKSGASEFYCGYSPDSWNFKYNKLKHNKCLPIALNKRENFQANIREFNELKQMANFAIDNKLTLFVALNNMSFPIQVYSFLYNYLQRLKEIGINGIIVSDIGLISFIKKEFPNFYIVLSCLNPPDNTDSLNFFYDLGVNRITFPQHPSLKSIIEISNKQKKLDYECFILEGRCIYDQARCHSLHSIGFFCQDTWYYDYYGKKNDVSYKELEQLKSNEGFYNGWINPYFSLDHEINKWRMMSCGLCSLPYLLKDSGITTLKIAGRDSSSSGKIMMVRLVSKALKNLENNPDLFECKDLVSSTFGFKELCENKMRCLIPSKQY